MKPWYCCNCESVVNLDAHGRCEVCQSDAVDVAVRPHVTVESLLETYFPGELADLEAVWHRLQR